MRPLRSFAALTIVASMLMACGHDDSGTPTSPTNPSATVRAVTVTAAPTSATTFQLNAHAQFSDGSSRDVTAAARWETSNASLATITPSGVLTAVGSGQVEVRATFENVTGTMSLRVTGPPSGPTYVITGRVSETPPSPKPLPGVTVMIVAGPDAGQSTTTDADGSYRIGAVHAATISLEAHKDGYVTWRLSNLIVASDRSQLDIVLFPTPPTDASGVSATARCNDGSWSWARTRAEACTTNGGIAYTVCPGPMCNTQTASQGR